MYYMPIAVGYTARRLYNGSNK